CGTRTISTRRRSAASSIRRPCSPAIVPASCSRSVIEPSRSSVETEVSRRWRREGHDGGGGRVPPLWRFGVLLLLSRFGGAAQGLRAVPEALRRAFGARSQRNVPVRRARTDRPPEPRGDAGVRGRRRLDRRTFLRGARGRSGFL